MERDTGFFATGTVHYRAITLSVGLSVDIDEKCIVLHIGFLFWEAWFGFRKDGE